MWRLSFRCHTCFQVGLADECLGGGEVGMISCPHCRTVYPYGRLRDSKEAGFRQQYGCKRLIIFPHIWTTVETEAMRRLKEVQSRIGFDEECE